MELKEKCKCGAEFFASYEDEIDDAVIGELRMRHDDFREQHEGCVKTKRKNELTDEQIAELEKVREMLLSYEKMAFSHTGGSTGGAGGSGTWKVTGLSSTSTKAQGTISAPPSVATPPSGGYVIHDTGMGPVAFWRTQDSTSASWKFTAKDDLGNVAHFWIDDATLRTDPTNPQWIEKELIRKLSNQRLANQNKTMSTAKRKRKVRRQP